MTDHRLLGMPLDKARALLDALGLSPKVIFTAPPDKTGAGAQNSGDEREAFVVGVRGDTLIAAKFRVRAPRSEA